MHVWHSSGCGGGDGRFGGLYASGASRQERIIAKFEIRAALQRREASRQPIRRCERFEWSVTGCVPLPWGGEFRVILGPAISNFASGAILQGWREHQHGGMISAQVTSEKGDSREFV